VGEWSSRVAVAASAVISVYGQIVLTVLDYVCMYVCTYNPVYYWYSY
jgi:hypothetical protein